MYKRGYENGEQSLEIYEGRVDVVLYNQNPDSSSFYFYRFQSEDVFNEKLGRDVNLLYRYEVEEFLKERGLSYDEMIKELLSKAWSENMRARDEM